MLKGELISLIRDRLVGGDSTGDMKGRWHPKIISKWVDVILSSVAAESIKKGVVADNNLLDYFIKPYPSVAIAEDEDRDEKYSILPATPVNLPNGKGIVIISPKQSQQFKFIPRSNNSAHIYNNLEVSTLSDRVTYYVEGRKVFYDNRVPYDLTSVLIKLVVFDGLDDDDEINIPAGEEIMVIDKIVSYIQGKLPEDPKEDLIPQQIAQ